MITYGFTKCKEKDLRADVSLFTLNLSYLRSCPAISEGTAEKAKEGNNKQKNLKPQFNNCRVPQSINHKKKPWALVFMTALSGDNTHTVHLYACTQKYRMPESAKTSRLDDGKNVQLYAHFSIKTWLIVPVVGLVVKLEQNCQHWFKEDNFLKSISIKAIKTKKGYANKKLTYNVI